MTKFFILSSLLLLASSAKSAVFIKKPMLDGRIVGGQVIDIKEVPYQCSLIKSDRHICGAVLISPTKALTAAHCTRGAISLKLRCGTSNYKYGGSIVNIKTVCQHPDFNPSTIDYDVSILILETAVPYTPIEASSSLNDPSDGRLLQVTGWGTTQNPLESNELLRGVIVPVVNRQVCNETYKLYGGITENMICAGDFINGGKDSCQGDSGGPLVDTITKKLVGLVSWGLGCAQKRYPGVYTNIRKFDSWIKNPKGYCHAR